MNTDLISREDLQIEITKQIAYFHDRANTTSIYDDKLAYTLKATGLELARVLIETAPAVPMQGQELGCEICVNRNIKSKEVCTSPFGECKFFNCGADMQKGEENEVN